MQFTSLPLKNNSFFFFKKRTNKASKSFTAVCYEILFSFSNCLYAFYKETEKMQTTALFFVLSSQLGYMSVI